MEIDIEKVRDIAIELIMQYGPKVLLAILVLLIGLRIIKMLQKMIRRAAGKSQMEESLQSFFVSLAGWILKILLIIAVAEMVGVKTTSFIAILGAAGLAIGLALQGTLANFAGGVLCLIFKPYKIGDLIESQGQLGVVKEIQIFNTIALSPENKTIILPNGAVMNNHIINYTAEGKIRVDLKVGIGYGEDMKKARELIMEMVVQDERVLKDPAPTVAVSELGDSSVNLVVRPYCHPSQYWDVYFDTTQRIKEVLDANKIQIPFPQRDVHLKQ